MQSRVNLEAATHALQRAVASRDPESLTAAIHAAVQTLAAAGTGTGQQLQQVMIAHMYHPVL